MRPGGLIVAIDGPAGAGKTTATRNLARRLGYTYLDTGATLRAVALKALRSGADLDGDAMVRLAREASIEFVGDEGERVWLDGEDVTAEIRTQEISTAASHISTHPEVRRALMGLWRTIGENGGVVMEGRDIGTVVFPDADLKFFLVARQEIRAERRYLEQQDRPRKSLGKVAEELARRDRADRTRQVAPLVRAADAIEVDTSLLTPEQTVDIMERQVRLLSMEQRNP